MQRSTRIALAAATALLVVVGVARCDSYYQRERRADAPLGFGVDSEEHLHQILLQHSMPDADARCVARRVFEGNPPHGTGIGFDVDHEVLASAGEACDIIWTAYDFTDD